MNKFPGKTFEDANGKGKECLSSIASLLAFKTDKWINIIFISKLETKKRRKQNRMVLDPLHSSKFARPTYVIIVFKTHKLEY